MNRRIAHIFQLLVVGPVTLNGIAPAAPVASAAPYQLSSSAEMPQRAASLEPLSADRSAPASAAPALDAEAIDPGDWDQGYPSAAGDSAGNLYAVWQDYR